MHLQADLKPTSLYFCFVFSYICPKSTAMISKSSIIHLVLLMDLHCVFCKVGSKLFFKYLVTTLTDQNSIQEEIKSRLKLGNACYHSVQNLSSSRLLSKNLKIKIYRTIILPVILYGCETWSLTLREECRLRVLRIIFGSKRAKVT